MKAIAATFLAAASLALMTQGASAQAGSKTLDLIKQKGALTCGTNTGLAGFGLPMTRAIGRASMSISAVALPLPFSMTRPK